MPIGGETVGRAYVRILADGTDLPKGIRDSLKDKGVEKVYADAGREHNDAYNQAFAKRQKENSKKTKDELAKALDIGQGRLDATAKNISRGMFTALHRELKAPSRMKTRPWPTRSGRTSWVTTRRARRWTRSSAPWARTCRGRSTRQART